MRQESSHVKVNEGLGFFCSSLHGGLNEVVTVEPKMESCQLFQLSAAHQKSAKIRF